MSKELTEMIKRECRSKGKEISDEEAATASKNIAEFFRLLDKWDKENIQSQQRRS
jgi:hypothetical protein